MNLIKKLKNWRTNHKIATAIMDGAAIFAAGNAGAAAIDALVETKTPIIQEASADYFDGMRGPNLLQLDQRLSFNEEGNINYTLLPKGFLDLVDDNEKGKAKGGLFGVTPISYSPGTSPAVGVGVGGYVNLGNVGLLGVVPIVYNSEGEVTNINPTLYATIMAGKMLIDPRISYLAQISGDNTTHNVSFGSTFGYIIDNVILGFDIGSGFDPSNASNDDLRNQLKYQGIIRIDLDQKHKHWVQAYLGKDTVGIGFRTNLDFK